MSAEKRVTRSQLKKIVERGKEFLCGRPVNQSVLEYPGDSFGTYMLVLDSYPDIAGLEFKVEVFGMDFSDPSGTAIKQLESEYQCMFADISEMKITITQDPAQSTQSTQSTSSAQVAEQTLRGINFLTRAHDSDYFTKDDEATALFQLMKIVYYLICQALKGKNTSQKFKSYAMYVYVLTEMVNRSRKSTDTFNTALNSLIQNGHVYKHVLAMKDILTLGRIGIMTRLITRANVYFLEREAALQSTIDSNRQKQLDVMSIEENTVLKAKEENISDQIEKNANQGELQITQRDITLNIDKIDKTIIEKQEEEARQIDLKNTGESILSSSHQTVSIPIDIAETVFEKIIIADDNLKIAAKTKLENIPLIKTINLNLLKVDIYSIAVAKARSKKRQRVETTSQTYKCGDIVTEVQKETTSASKENLLLKSEVSRIHQYDTELRILESNIDVFESFFLTSTNIVKIFTLPDKYIFDLSSSFPSLDDLELILVMMKLAEEITFEPKITINLPWNTSIWTGPIKMGKIVDASFIQALNDRLEEAKILMTQIPVVHPPGFSIRIINIRQKQANIKKAIIRSLKNCIIKHLLHLKFPDTNFSHCFGQLTLGGASSSPSQFKQDMTYFSREFIKYLKKARPHFAELVKAHGQKAAIATLLKYYPRNIKLKDRPHFINDPRFKEQRQKLHKLVRASFRNTNASANGNLSPFAQKVYEQVQELKNKS